MMRLVINVPSGFVLSYGKKNLRTVMRRAGAEVAAAARALLRASNGGGRYYAVRHNGGLELHQASAPGQPPASMTGQLASSIRVKVNRTGDGVSVKEGQFYGKFLETGARGGGPARRNRRVRQAGLTTIFPVGTRILAPRPYLSAALEQKEAGIAADIQASVLQDIEFKTS
jgi:hypothetical protein